MVTVLTTNSKNHGYPLPHYRFVLTNEMVNKISQKSVHDILGNPQLFCRSIQFKFGRVLAPYISAGYVHCNDTRSVWKWFYGHINATYRLNVLCNWYCICGHYDLIDHLIGLRQ